MQKPSVSIAIPAYNEETSISNILSDLILQKHANFTLKEILVYSDSSTDKTDEKVKDFNKKNRIIKLIKGQERKGKYSRVNQAFKECKTDYLVVLDADIELIERHFLEKLLDILISDKSTNMVAAYNVLLPHDNFIGKIIHAYLMIWEYVRLSIPNHQTALNFYGSATAYRGSFARSVIIPSDLLDPHLFIYLSAQKTKGFRYCKDAKVLQWSIGTLHDLKKLLRRTIGKKDKKLEKIFGEKTKKIYFVPWKYKIIGLLKAIKSQPIYTPLALILHFFITKILNLQNTEKTPVWDIILSTKKPIKGKLLKL